MPGARSTEVGRVLCVLVLLSGLLGGSERPASAQQVTVPLSELQSLWDRVHPPAVSESALVALESARFAIEVGEGSARVEMELSVWSRGTAWQTVTVPLAGRLEAFRFAGLEARLESAGPEVKVAVRGAGRGSLHLESRLELTRQHQNRRRSARFELVWPLAPTVSGTLTASQGRAEALLSGDELVALAEGRWQFFAPPGGTSTFELFEVVEAEPPRPFSASVDSYCALSISRARLKATAWLRVRTSNGVMERLRIPLPAGYEVLEVSGAAVGGWQLDDAALEVTPLSPIAGTEEITVQLAADLADEVECPILGLEGVRTEEMGVRAAVANLDGLVELVDPGAYTRLESEWTAPPQGFTAAGGAPLRVGSGQRSPRYRITWPTSKEVLEAAVDRLLIEALVGDSGEMLYRVWAVLRSSGVANLRISMPPGARWLEGSLDGEPLQPGRADEQWVLPIGSREEAQVLYLVALAPQGLSAPAKELALPMPRLSAPAARVEIRLLLPPGRRCALIDANRAGNVGPVPSPGGISTPRTELSLRPTRHGLLQPPPGFQVLEASWTGWTTEPPPLRISLAPLAAKEGRR